ncbi:hypothetical protein M0R45_010240 [Rubus argutus]|uniref:40S ribosomal protein S8 n=1 Tax=Rubus argutus TaxID=59490 RepID=A0AAW1Y888_RUBAR
MGISRDSMHKRRATGGKKKAWRKKRKYELGRQPANTKISSNKTVRRIRVRGGNVKWRALRTQTLVKSAIVQVDAAPFRQWYLQHYNVDIGRKKKSAKKDAKDAATEEGDGTTEETKKSGNLLRKLEKRQKDRTLDSHIEEQADGYILEGKELEFYMKKLQRKKGKAAGATA